MFQRLKNLPLVRSPESRADTNTAEANADDERIVFAFDGQSVQAHSGESVATALLANNIVTLRHNPVSGAPRAPYCLMGACYECLVRIDGRVVQACMTSVRRGMQVEKVANERD